MEEEHIQRHTVLTTVCEEQKIRKVNVVIVVVRVW